MKTIEMTMSKLPEYLERHESEVYRFILESATTSEAVVKTLGHLFETEGTDDGLDDNAYLFIAKRYNKAYNVQFREFIEWVGLCMELQF